MASTRMWQTFAVFVVFCKVTDSKEIPKPIHLTEETWRDMLEGEWLVKFYAPWCPACKALAPVWDKVASWTEDINFKVGMVDVTDSPGLSGRFLVMALPTVYHVKDGVFRTYRGPREEKAIVSYVDDRQWEDIDPIPWYKSPAATHMGALGMFFKLSMSIRDMHTAMTEEYGIPVWGSYTIFAIATIILGLVIGLVIVFLCDFMFPPSPPIPSHYGLRRGANNLIDDSKDNDSDVIVDDRPQNPNEDFQDENLDEAENDEENENAESSTRRRKPKASSD